MYAKVSGSTVEKFPYNLGDLRRDNPNVSFPSGYDLADADGVVAVTQGSDPTYDPNTEKLVQGIPTDSSGDWVVTRVVEPLSLAELKEVDRQADIQALKVDPQVLALLKARPNQINNYIDNNVTDLDSAKEVLKIYGRALAVLAYALVN